MVHSSDVHSSAAIKIPRLIARDENEKRACQGNSVYNDGGEGGVWTQIVGNIHPLQTYARDIDSVYNNVGPR